MLNQFSSLDQVAIAIKTTKRTIVLVSTYMPFDSINPPPEDVLYDLTDYCNQNNYELLISSDANSHHVSWGSTDCNARGENLLNFIINKNLVICNKGNTPTFETINRREVLDITLASQGLADVIAGWHVSKRETFSDHKYIKFKICEKVTLINSNFRNPRKTCWEKYRKNLHDSNLNFLNTDSINDKAEKLEECITNAFNDSCKPSKGKTGEKPPWWTPKLEEMKTEVFKLKRRMKRHKHDITKADYDRAKKNYKTEIKVSKAKSWQKFCTDMNDINSTARVHKLLKMGKREDIGSLKKDNGEFTTTPKETLETLLNTHFPDDPNNHQNSTTHEKHSGNGKLDIDKVINRESVKAALLSFKPYKSPGMDGIFPVLLQQGMEYLLDLIVEIYRDCLKKGTTPDKWLETKISFIPKPGKQCYFDPKDLRPISLFSFLLKGLERCIHWYLNDTHLKDKFSKNIYSYREGIGTEDALHSLVFKIEKALEKGEHALVLFLDLSAAFSSVTVESIIKNLKSLGVEDEILNWANHMLLNRKAYAFLSGEQMYKIVVRGTPQGGVLSIIFWNSGSQNLMDRFPKTHPTETKAFADDSASIAVGIDPKVLGNNIQKDIKIMEEWAKDHGLKFNAKKTKAMFFTNKKGIEKPKLFIDGEEIEYVKEFKYLGVVIDDKLSWKKHINHTSNKATATFMQCQNMMGKTWGLSPKITRWTYTSLIRPILSYGSMIWLKGTTQTSKLNPLVKIQRRACLATLNAMRTTPTASMELLLDIQPINIFLQTCAINTHLRLKDNGNWIPKVGETTNPTNHTKLVETLAAKTPTLYMPIDKLINRHRVRTDFDTQINSREEINKTITIPRPNKKSTINCFTDGSRFDETSGAGFTIHSTNSHTNGFLNLGKYSTVFQAEVIAILRASETMINKKISNKQVEIYVDNQAAIQALGKYETNSKIILECKLSLNRLAENNSVRLNWIPGHSGHRGNNVADNLAKLGVKQKTSGPEPIIPISTATRKDELKTWANKKHETYWKNLTSCRQSKYMMPNTGNNIWKQIRDMNKSDIRIITHMMTGHSTLQKHLCNMKIEEDPTCEQCLEDTEDLEHYLTDCPAFATIRQRTFGETFLKRVDLKNLSIKNILKYVKRTKRFE